MGHCTDCRWWEPTTPYGMCRRLTGDSRMRLPAEGALAVIECFDPHDEAVLLTLPDFGCVQFEAKEV